MSTQVSKRILITSLIPLMVSGHNACASAAAAAAAEGYESREQTQLPNVVQFDGLVVSGFPKVLMKEDGKPEQDLVGSLVVMGSQRDMASCKSAAEKHPKLTVRYVVNDLPELNNSETGTDGAAVAGASAPSDNDTAIIETTETFRVQSLLTLWAFELMPADSLFKIKRVLLNNLFCNETYKRMFDHIFAPFVLTEKTKAAAYQILGVFDELSNVGITLKYLNKMDFDDLQSTLIAFYETGVSSKYIKNISDFSELHAVRMGCNDNFKDHVRVLKETGVWEKCDFSSELMILSSLISDVGEDVFVETVDLLKASGAWDSLTATNIFSYIQMLSKLTDKDARKQYCTQLMAEHRSA